MIRGLGTDLASVRRLKAARRRAGSRFDARVFTPAERAAARRRADADLHLAGRFAAKEAVMKALGTGWTAGVTWQGIEILADRSGRPVLKLTGATARKAKALGIRRWQLSISHDAGMALAVAIAEG